jgi:Xaa-Pro aminopeptidase
MNAERLDLLRHELRDREVQGFIVPCTDPHLGEYMPPHDQRLAWLTGFTGSAGIAIVLENAAMVFSDGRYTLQLASQTDPALWQRGHMIETPPAEWLAKQLDGRTKRIGYDPRLISQEALKRYTDRGIDMAPLIPNPIDAVWADQPPPPAAPARIQPLEHAGHSAADKREAIAALLRAEAQDAAVLSDPASINWLLNLRGADVEFTPFALCFALIGADSHVDLFIDSAKLTPSVHAWLGNAVSVRPPAELPGALAARAGQRVRVDPAGTSAWFAQTLREAGASVIDGADPCLLPKALKNLTEQEGARAAHLRDAVALCRFLHAMFTRVGMTEMSAAALLDGMRAEHPAYRGESFPAISGAGEHGAIIHYRVTPETDRPINPNEAYLIDSGGQYEDGTTDVTRTLWTGPAPAPSALRDHYTRVLAGHLEISALIFPEGIAGPHIDMIARTALWRVGLDYDHGTGHGVGSYLSVHEGPAGIARTAKPVPLAAGMILSNEPGYYLPGEYGIRIENLLLVKPALLPNARKPFLRFETLTLAPYDRALIEPGLLTPAQRQQVDVYHARVFDEVGRLLPPQASAWLAAACAPLTIPCPASEP